MKKQLLSFLLVCCTILTMLPLSVFAENTENSVSMHETISVWDGSVASSFTHGDGSENNPYQIATGSDLAYLAKSVNEGNNYADTYFVQTINIDLRNIEWTPIGNNITMFNGYYDGGMYSINNLTFFASSSDYMGLFGAVNGTLKNIIIENAELTGQSYIGIIAGLIQCDGSNGTIENCTVKNGTVSGKNYVGGIVGHARGDIFGCSIDSCTVNGNDNVGGVTGSITIKIIVQPVSVPQILKIV